MKYQDYTDPESKEKYINGHYVGIKHGTPTNDKLGPNRDGYEHIREAEQHGTITQDKLETIRNPIEKGSEVNG